MTERENALVRRQPSPTPARLVGLLAAYVLSASLATAQTLPDYLPLLPAVKQKATKVDPYKGYVVTLLKPGIYMITEGVYESMFVTTGEGVVLFDAPPSFARYISQAVAETSKEPIVGVVYSHLHVDHIGGAGLILKEHPGIESLAEQGTTEFLREMQDPNRPVPTHSFKDRYTLRVGSLTANMTLGLWHSPEGDLLISIPDRKVLMAVDALSTGATPFMGLDLSINMHEYLIFFDQLQAMEFDVMVPGHHGTPATKKKDVAIVREPVDPTSYHFGMNPIFETQSGKYDWINRIIAVGTGHRLAEGPLYNIFELL